jgi:phospholipid/cholesterol/gamma-HCH transport system substrate-binding protein
MGAITYKVVKLTADNASASAGYAVFARFHDASGLYSKSRVQTAGIPIGQIEDRTLDPDRPVARVTVRIMPNIKLYENAVVAKKAASLLGEYFLEVDPGSPEGFVNGQKVPMRLLKSGDEIKDVREPTAMGDIMNDVGTIMPILRDILTDVRRLTSGPVSTIAENLNKMIATNSVVLERLMLRVDHIAADVENVTGREKEDLVASIKNVRQITESIKQFVGTTEGEVTQTGTSMRQSLDKVQGTLASLDHTLKNLEKISDRVERGEGTVGHILNDDTIARNVEDITEDAGTLVHGVTSLQTLVGLRSEYNVVASTFKNYLSIQLVPRPDKFYLIELVDDPKGYRSVTNTFTQNITDPTHSQVTRTTTYTDTRLKFTFQFGKTYGALTGRFGIKESTGGFGADLRLFDGHLLLSTDVFDFKYSTYPRVQTRLSAALWKDRIYLIAGADDVINNRASAGGGGGFDLFFGGQLIFNDEDLKSFLLFGGGAAAGAAAR